MYQAARNQDVLVIQSPGGWGNTHYRKLQGWKEYCDRSHSHYRELGIVAYEAVLRCDDACGEEKLV